MAIGPDGKFGLGTPIRPYDQGGLHCEFIVNKSMRRGIMRFGTAVSWLVGSPEEMQRMATGIRSRCFGAFGRLRYDKSTLPIRVIANRDKRLIELYLPQSMEMLIANPEMWLALSDKIETTIALMKN